MIALLLGFAIALTVGLTGIGGGSFTVPALLLLFGLPATEGVGTAFIFAGILRLIAAPFYLLKRRFHAGYLRTLLLGAVPGLIAGMLALHWVAGLANSRVVIIVLGCLLVASASVTFLPRIQNRQFARRNAGWLGGLAFVIGTESGFSSAGAGALGSVLLLNYSEMSPAEVAGTDMLFGLVLAAIGSGLHLTLGSISVPVLARFVAGGVPGVVLGSLLAPAVPAQKLKSAMAIIAIATGVQLAWTGARRLSAHQRVHFAAVHENTSRSAGFKTAREQIDCIGESHP